MTCYLTFLRLTHRFSNSIQIKYKMHPFWLKLDYNLTVIYIKKKKQFAILDNESLSSCAIIAKSAFVKSLFIYIIGSTIYTLNCMTSLTNLLKSLQWKNLLSARILKTIIPHVKLTYEIKTTRLHSEFHIILNWRPNSSFIDSFKLLWRCALCLKNLTIEFKN